MTISILIPMYLHVELLSHFKMSLKDIFHSTVVNKKISELSNLHFHLVACYYFLIFQSQKKDHE